MRNLLYSAQLWVWEHLRDDSAAIGLCIEGDKNEICNKPEQSLRGLGAYSKHSEFAQFRGGEE